MCKKYTDNHYYLKVCVCKSDWAKCIVLFGNCVVQPPPVLPCPLTMKPIAGAASFLHFSQSMVELIYTTHFFQTISTAGGAQRQTTELN